MYGYGDIDWSVTVIEPPAVEPVTLAAAKLHCRVDADEEDELLELAIAAAREWVEAETRRSLVTRTLRLTLDRFPGGRALLLPRGPVRSLDAIRCVTPAAETETVDADDYRLADATPPRVLLAPGAAWPATIDAPAAVEVDYVAGDVASAVPAALRQAILLLVADAYQNREASFTGTIVAANPAVARLIAPYRMVEVP